MNSMFLFGMAVGALIVCAIVLVALYAHLRRGR